MSWFISTAETVWDCGELSQLHCFLFVFANRFVYIAGPLVDDCIAGLVMKDVSHLLY